MLSPKAQKTIEEIKRTKEQRRTLSVEKQRELQKISRTMPLPDDAKQQFLTLDGVEVEKVTLPSSKDDSALVFIHGGGFTIGSSAVGRWITTQITRRTGQTVYSINYRLAPEYTYPTATFDCVMVWKYLLEHGVRAEKSTMMGTSAGGTIVLSLALWCRDHDTALPSSLILNSPGIARFIKPTEEEIAEDIMLTYDENEENPYFSTADDGDCYAFPICASYTGFPPVAVYCAEKEILHRHSVILDSLLTRDGVEHTYTEDGELWHAFLNNPIPENEIYAAEIASFIKKNIKQKEKTC